MRTDTSLHGSSHAGLHFDGIAIARSVATFLGAAFLGIALIGLLSPGFLGAHLNPVHTAIHIVSAAASLWFGLAGTARGVSGFCLSFGVLYGLLGVAGFLFGVPEQHAVAGIVHGADTRLLQVIPGHLELATPDHLIHVAIATLYVVAGLMGTASARHADDRR